MFKRIITVLVTFTLLLGCTSCNGGKKVNDAVPVYIEKDFATELDLKSIEQIKLNSKNQLVAYDGQSKSYITIDHNGKMISEIKAGFPGDGRAFALDTKDNMYILEQNPVVDEKTYKVKENSRKLHIFGPTGDELKSIDFGKSTMQNNENIFVHDIAVDPKENIYLIKYNEGFEIMNKDGRQVDNSHSGTCSFITVYKDDRIVIGSMGAQGVKSYIEMLDSSRNSIWKKEIEVGSFIHSITYSSSDQSIYAITDKGIDKYDSKGNLVGKTLDFMKYNLLKDQSNVSGIAVDSSKNIYLLIWEYGNSPKCKMKKFEIGTEVEKAGSNSSGTKQIKSKKSLALAAHFSDRWLETAVSTFQTAHPDIEINIKDYKAAYYGGGDTPEQASKRSEEFTKTINTELMAGKGPDIIYFGALPYRKYIDKNVFCNLSELMENDKEFNAGEINMNILNALKYKGGIYTIPINYQFDVLVGSKAILDKEGIKIDDRKWTWNDFVSISEKLTKDTNNDGTPDQYALSGRGNLGIFMQMFEDIEDRIIDMEKKKADFTGKDFTNLLDFNKILMNKKLIYESGDWNQTVEKTSRGGIVFNFSSIPGYGMAKYYKENVYAGDIYLFHMPSDKDPGARSGKFNVGNMFAINQNSKSKEEAWKFLKLLMSKEVQSSPELQNGFPVNKEALKENAKFCKDVLKLDQAYIDQIDSFIPDLKEYRYSDDQVTRIIREESGQFFTGKRTADDTVRVIQNKINTYLGE